MSSVTANTDRRPNRSASNPPRVAPIAMPTNPAEAIHEGLLPRQRPLGDEGGEHERDEPDVHGIQRPTEPRTGQHLQMRPH